MPTEESSPERLDAVRSWMVRLADRAYSWVGSQNEKAPYCGPLTATEAYVDLLFAWGLASVDEAGASNSLLQRAGVALRDKGEAHSFLLRAYTWRIEQALDSQPHQGMLPSEQRDELRRISIPQVYLVDRLREQSRVLEPTLRIEPYRHVYGRLGGVDNDLAQLPDLNDSSEVSARVEELLPQCKTPVERARILQVSLGLAPCVSQEFARSLLSQILPTCEQFGVPTDHASYELQVRLLTPGLFVATYFNWPDCVLPLVDRFTTLRTLPDFPTKVRALEGLTEQCIRSLLAVGLRNEADVLLRQVTGWVIECQRATSLIGLWRRLIESRNDPEFTAVLRTLLHVAGGWLSLGEELQARSVMDASRQLLLANVLPWREQVPLASAYVGALGHASWEMAGPRIDGLFPDLQNIRDTYVTMPHFSRSQLLFVETVVWTCLSEPLARLTGGERTTPP